MSPVAWLRVVGALCFALAALVTSLMAAAPPRPSDPDPEPLGAKFTNSVGMKFVRVKKGTFLMGAAKDETGARDDEKPQHEVAITTGFFVGVHEVTQKQYRAVTGNNPSYFSRNGNGKDKVKDVRDKELDDFPVENVSWDDVQAFVRKLNTLEARAGRGGREYRL